MNEFFKDIPGYEGLYQASNLGNIKNINTGMVLRQQIDKLGYKRLSLGYNTKFTVHRLIAITFIENKNHLPIINHIDGNPSNNNINNLEWCTYSYNNKHSYERLNRKPPSLGLFGKDNKLSIKVSQYNLEGELLKIWDSISDIGRELGADKSHIVKNCKGKIKSHMGFIFQYWHERHSDQLTRVESKLDNLNK